MAQLKGDKHFRIKVGSAIGNPIERIRQQFTSSKTAVPEQPIVLLLFQTLSARHLERWLHKQLAHADDATGAEWFHTNSEELIDLFRQYLRVASSPTVEIESEATAPRVPLTAQQKSQRKSSTFVRMGPATKGEDVIVFRRHIRTRKQTAELRSEKQRQGHHIHEALERLSPVTVQFLSDQTGLTLARVIDHVNWAIHRGLAELKSNQTNTI